MFPLVESTKAYARRIAPARAQLILFRHNLKTLDRAATVGQQLGYLAASSIRSDGRRLDAVRAGTQVDADEGVGRDLVLTINATLADLGIIDARAFNFQRDRPPFGHARFNFER